MGTQWLYTESKSATRTTYTNVRRRNPTKVNKEIVYVCPWWSRMSFSVSMFEKVYCGCEHVLILIFI